MAETMKEGTAPYYIVVKDGKETKVDLLSVISEKDFWATSKGVRIISHVGIEKIADKEGISEKDFVCYSLPNKDNHQQHAVNIWVGFNGDNCRDNWRRGDGEASTLNTGKAIESKNEKGVKELRVLERNSVDSSFKFAMACKRAYDRAVLRLVKLYGIYSEVEAKEFSKPLEEGDFNF
jgi:hypothetical protein